MTDDEKTIKCVVWDLDETVWDGILLEDAEVKLRPGVLEVMRTLDERGILNSVASRNEHDLAMRKLTEFGVAEYLLHPQINWGPKSTSVRTVAEAINIGLDTVAFVDDQPFERDEVAHLLPEVLCIDSLDAERIPDLARTQPRFVTDNARRRRVMYQADARRTEAEQRYEGTSADFLASLDMRFSIAPAAEVDLQRAEELTVRTNQLNATGYTYSYEELDAFRRSPDHDLYIAALDDRYGTYGQIGLALVERGTDAWTIKLLLMSCRVMSRGVGSVLLNHLIRTAAAAGVPLRAEFVPTDRNRTMYVTYKFAGFRDLGGTGGVQLLEHDGSDVPEFPPYMTVTVA
ncbi:HAD-IIIC family phosphatase [Micromonospora sp. C31]|uniref:HAD-IIIC family phosphatase n=1 Tax=Micromonospora sp. C31 TaxID=2824876 RepID=UPI001B374086|nr:HAD-IIIC family phosphatase [Micromonospora sp. C31]MBQ1076231.1 HAD-IIIC family phosphatase [Micromonospora sp. C31]